VAPAISRGEGKTRAQQGSPRRGRGDFHWTPAQELRAGARKKTARASLRREPHGLPLIRAIGKNTDMLTH